jgi:hypothetical protein
LGRQQVKEPNGPANFRVGFGDFLLFLLGVRGGVKPFGSDSYWFDEIRT